MNDQTETETSGPDNDSGAGLSGLAHSESAGEITARYDQWASGYDSDLAAWGYSVPVSIAEELQRCAGLTQTNAGPILDAGCGTGLVGRALHDCGFAPIDGVDASAESLNRATNLGIYRSLLAMDLRAPLPIPDTYYYSVVCVGVLTYLSNTEAVLREFLRITQPAGYVIATQRTDLWAERDCDAVIQALIDDELCQAVVDGPQPYLPDHHEYADQILAKTIILHRS